jgi:hypothetical protein
MPDVAGNDCVVKEVRFPERLTIILLELSGFAISARMARLPEPCAVRGSPRPAEGQNRRTAPGATVQLIAPIVFPPYWMEPEATKRGTDTGK